MWRVLDNLLSNACKYACAGTRLYIAARREGETVAFSFKNISRDALNIDPDELIVDVGEARDLGVRVHHRRDSQIDDAADGAHEVDDGVRA